VASAVSSHRQFSSTVVQRYRGEERSLTLAKSRFIAGIKSGNTMWSHEQAHDPAGVEAFDESAQDDGASTKI
jgi:hypothetical protein